MRIAKCFAKRTTEQRVIVDLILIEKCIIDRAMSRINLEKMKGLSNVDDIFNQKYGEEDSASRLEFEAEAKAWYYSELSKEE